MRLRIFKSVMLMVLFAGCTDEPDATNFVVSLKNGSGQVLKIETFNNDILVYQVDLGNGENGPECAYVDENFKGMLFNYCNIDSLVIKFNNNKGYISTRNNLGNFNFSNKRNPLLPNGGFDLSNNVYKFIISQEDFENAHVLP